MMWFAFVVSIAIDVSLGGATAAQSVETFAAVDVGVEQIGLAGFLNWDTPGVPSLLLASASKLFQCWCVIASGAGSSADAVAAASAAASTTRTTPSAAVLLPIPRL